MPYALKDKLSQTPIAGGIEITDGQYKQAIKGRVEGKLWAEKAGVFQEFVDKTQKVYSTETGQGKDISILDDMPEGYTEVERPDEFYKFVGGEWVLDQNAKKADDDKRRLEEIDNRLAQIDTESVRPLRAINAGTDTQFDRDKLTALDTEAEALRVERAELQGV